MRVPSASEIFMQLPRDTWFEAPAAVREIYPDLAECEKKLAVTKAIKKLGKEAKRETIMRTGEPGHYKFFIPGEKQ